MPSFVVIICLGAQTTSRVGWQSPQDDEHYVNGNDSNYMFHVRSTATSPRETHRKKCGNGVDQNASQYSKSVDAKYLMRTPSVERAATKSNRNEIQPQSKPSVVAWHQNSPQSSEHRREMFVRRDEFFSRVEEAVNKNGYYCSERDIRCDRIYASEESFTTDAMTVGERTSSCDGNNGLFNGMNEDLIAVRSITNGNGNIYGRIMNGKVVNDKQCTVVAGNKRQNRPMPTFPPPPPPMSLTSIQSQSKPQQQQFYQNPGIKNRGNFNGHAYDIPADCFYASELSPRAGIQQRKMMQSSPLLSSSSNQKQRQKQLHANSTSSSTTHLNSSRPLSHALMNSLSSPESAYSTGYSTDGTSPGNLLNVRVREHRSRTKKRF